jgi:hypothetical protein
MRPTTESREPSGRQATGFREIPSASPFQDIVDLGLERPPVRLRRGFQLLQDNVVEVAHEHIGHEKISLT